MATARMAIPLPAETDIPDGPAQITAAANRIDIVGAMWDTGTLAARPAAGKAGRVYWAIDRGRHGQLFWDTGTAWYPVEPSIPVVVTNVGLAGADGDIVDLRFFDATGRPVVWRLRYDGDGNAFPWKPIGAAPLHTEITVSTTFTASSADTVVAANVYNVFPGRYLVKCRVSALPTMLAGSPGATACVGVRATAQIGGAVLSNPWDIDGAVNLDSVNNGGMATVFSEADITVTQLATLHLMVMQRNLVGAGAFQVGHGAMTVIPLELGA